MNCKSCVYCRELKKDFVKYKGYTKSKCCIVFAKDDKEGFVVEVTDKGFCEMYKEIDK